MDFHSLPLSGLAYERFDAVESLDSIDDDNGSIAKHISDLDAIIKFKTPTKHGKPMLAPGFWH